MDLFWGIDGGGTQSRIKVIDRAGTVIYTQKSGATNIHATNKNGVKNNLDILLDNMVLALNRPLEDFCGGCFATAGMDSKSEQTFFKTYFKDTKHITHSIFYCNDSITALVGGIEKTEGYVLISGTGSIATSLSETGKIVRAGGWGHMLGDEGSGYWIGMQGIINGIRSSEKRDIASTLSEKVLTFYNLKTFRDSFNFIYTNFNKAKIAEFAKIVFQEDKNGDLLSKKIIDKAVHELALLFFSVYEHSKDIKNKELVFSGGIFEHEKQFQKRVALTCSTKIPELSIVTQKNDPAYGACLLAKKYCHSL